MRKVDKRGFWMGEESGKFILGVIAVVLLLTLAFKIGGIMIQNTKYEQAKYTLSEIETEINSLKEGEAGTVFVESPSKWWILAWPYQNSNEKPNQCDKYCICICPVPLTILGSTIKATKENSLKECNQNGICKSTNMPAITIDESPPDGKVAKFLSMLAEFFGKDTKNRPLAIQGPIKLKLEKTTDQITITLE